MPACKLYISKSQDPFENLALEEWALKNLDTSNSDYLILYVNRPSVVVGRNQNIFQEVNLAYCKRHDILVSRRISGGGTVFHDEGNLNWTFISAFDTKKVNEYKWAAEPIIKLLNLLNLKAYLTERNAIEVDGLKLSGQAQFTNRKNILSHGTLLVHAQLDHLQKAIEPNPKLQIESKASPSYRSKTSTISQLLKREVTMDEVIGLFKKSIRFAENQEMNAVLDINKLKSYPWIYERSPKFVAYHELDGERCAVHVEKAIVKAIKSGKGYLLQDNPFLNQTYEKFLINYS